MAFFRRSETSADDHARTGRMLDSLDAAYADRTGDQHDEPLTPFEEVVLEGSMALPGDAYPPAGHTFPRRG